MSKYNFKFQLPPQIPYSLKTRHSEIYYNIQAILDIPWAIDEKCKIPFMILPHLNLSFYPNLCTPCSFEKVKQFFTLDHFKTLKMMVMLPYTGFVVGEDVSITIRYENGSKVNVLRTRISLKQSIVLYSNANFPFECKDEKVERRKVFTSIEKGAIAGEITDVNAKFKVPPVLISNEKFCKVIVVRYYLKIKAEVNGLHISPKMQIPVTIGTMRIE